jgi:amidohydrolase family protein
MSNRQFFTQSASVMAGWVVAGRQLVNPLIASPQDGGATRRRQVMIRGRRIKTVDVHAHCQIPEVTDFAKQSKPPVPSNAYSRLLDFGPERLKAMDEQGIDVEVLSINPFWYSADRELARDLIKLQNEKLARICATNPDRFVGLATLALQFPDLAAEQLEEGVRKFGLRGGSIRGQVPGSTAELASPKFDPFWTKAEQLGVSTFHAPRESTRDRLANSWKRRTRCRTRPSDGCNRLPLTHDFPGNAGSLSKAQIVLCTWRRVSPVVR